MILYSDSLWQEGNITGAVLHESTREVGTLTLEFGGFGPDWLERMTPVTLMHAGRVLFHGKVTSVSRSADSSGVTTSVVVSNFLWLFDRLTLAQQIDAAREAQGEQPDASDTLTWEGSAVEMGQIAESWEAMAAATSLQAEGWMFSVSDEIPVGGTLTLEHSALLSGRACWAVTSGLVTTWSALLQLRDNAPDVQFVVDYERGCVTATAIGDMPSVTWDSSEMRIEGASGVTPQWDSCVTGVCVLRQREADPEENIEARTTVSYLYPPGVDMAQDGVKVIMIASPVEGDVQAVARQYYEAASVLQWGGTITARMEDVAGSPLGGKLNLTGPGMHPDWASMEAVVTAANWDFLTHLVSVELGRDFAEPQFSDADEEPSSWRTSREIEKIPTIGGGGGGESGGGGGTPGGGSVGTGTISGSSSGSGSGTTAGSGTCACSAELASLRTKLENLEKKYNAHYHWINGSIPVSTPVNGSTGTAQNP